MALGCPLTMLPFSGGRERSRTIDATSRLQRRVRTAYRAATLLWTSLAPSIVVLSPVLGRKAKDRGAHEIEVSVGLFKFVGPVSLQIVAHDLEEIPLALGDRSVLSGPHLQFVEDLVALGDEGIDVFSAFGAAVCEHDRCAAGQIEGRRPPSLNQATIQHAEIAEE
jgi:hypothetical protein